MNLWIRPVEGLLGRSHFPPITLAQERGPCQRESQDRPHRNFQPFSHALLRILFQLAGRRFPNFVRNWGYMVSAPPLVASYGIPLSSAYSLRYGFFPGR